MIENFLRILEEMDSFKKVAILFLTGIACVFIYFSFRYSEAMVIRSNWESIPHVIASSQPCNLVQLREKIYLVSIALPKPKNVSGVSSFTSSFWITSQPEDLQGMCDQLVLSIFSNKAESILKPHYDRIMNDVQIPAK